MKKVFLVVIGAVIIALAAINLNIALNSESNANLTLASVFSLAKGEEPWDQVCQTLIVDHGYTTGICPGTSQIVVTSTYQVYECQINQYATYQNSTCQTGTETTTYSYRLVGGICLRDYNEDSHTPPQTIFCPIIIKP